MSLKPSYYFLFLLLAFTKTNAQELISTDTLNVKENCIIYWQLTMPEYDSLFAQKSLKLDSLFYEFNVNIENMVPFLNKKGMKSLRFDGNVINFKTSAVNQIIHRQKLCSLYGVILFDALKPPLIIPGVNKNLYIMQKMKEYYGR